MINTNIIFIRKVVGITYYFKLKVQRLNNYNFEENHMVA